MVGRSNRKGTKRVVGGGKVGRASGERPSVVHNKDNDLADQYGGAVLLAVLFYCMKREKAVRVLPGAVTITEEWISYDCECGSTHYIEHRDKRRTRAIQTTR